MSDTDTVFDNWKSLRQKISNQRLPNAMTELTLEIEKEAISRAPVDTSALVNSAGHSVDKISSGWEGKVFFLMPYAFAVHEMPGTLKGQPRAHFGMTSNRSDVGPVMAYAFGGGTGKGNYWDGYGGGQAEPKFLKNAAEYVFSSGLAQKIIEDNLT